MSNTPITLHPSTSSHPADTTPIYTPKTYVIVGASRGIGLEFVRQLLARGDQVIAAVRDPFRANDLYRLSSFDQPPLPPQLQQEQVQGQGQGRRMSRPGALVICQCDVTREDSIDSFVREMKAMPDLIIDYLVLNAGILKYPNRATEISFLDFALHLSTNTIGPIVTASKLLHFTPPIVRNVVFISSDSGSTTNFRDFEDGFGAYAASKAALNQMLRHMAAELKRKGSNVCVLAMHPGEVMTDMAADAGVGWEVEGIIGVEESVAKMIPVIESKKGPDDSGTFWTWEGREHPW